MVPSVGGSGSDGYASSHSSRAITFDSQDVFNCFVWVVFQDFSVVSHSVTDNKGNTGNYELVGTYTKAGNFPNVQLFKILGAVGGANHIISVTEINDVQTYPSIFVAEVPGDIVIGSPVYSLDTASPFNSGNITTTENDTLLLAYTGFAGSDVIAVTWSNGFNSLLEVSSFDFWQGAVGYKNESTITSDSAECTILNVADVSNGVHVLVIPVWFNSGSGTSEVLNDVELQWSLLAALTSDTDIRWDVLKGITNDADFRWNVLQAVQQDADLRWSVLANIIKYSDLRWSILKLINKDVDLRWSVLQMIYRDLELRWDSDGSNSTVFSDATLQWSIIATIAQSLTLDWNVLQTITHDADIRWAILSAVAKDFEARWDVRQALQADATIEWNIIGTAAKTITLRWNIQSETSFEDISGVITVNSATGKITALTKTPVITTL